MLTVLGGGELVALVDGFRVHLVHAVRIPLGFCHDVFEVEITEFSESALAVEA